MTHRKRPPDEKHTVSIFGNPLLIKWVGQIATPITPDWKALEALKTLQHDDISLEYRVKPYWEPDPYFGGETGGEIIDIFYPTGVIRLDFSEIAWTSPQLCLQHWSCPEAFNQWKQSISDFKKK